MFGNHDLSLEQQVQEAAERIANQKAYSKEYETTQRVRPDDYKEDKSDYDVGYRARKLAEDPDHYNKLRNARRQRAIAEKTHFCKPCNRPFAYKSELTKHLNSDKHAKRLQELKDQANAARFFSGFKRKGDEAGLDDV